VSQVANPFSYPPLLRGHEMLAAFLSFCSLFHPVQVGDLAGFDFPINVESGTNGFFFLSKWMSVKYPFPFRNPPNTLLFGLSTEVVRREIYSLHWQRRSGASSFFLGKHIIYVRHWSFSSFFSFPWEVLARGEILLPPPPPGGRKMM